MINRKNIETVLGAGVLVLFGAAAADSIIYGSAQDEYCDAKKSRAMEIMAGQNLDEQFKSAVGSDGEMRIRWSYDASNDPDFPRIPVIGTTTCFGSVPGYNAE